MKISMIGCGKLGLPVALAWASKGHDVIGYDVTPWAASVIKSRKYPYIEPGAQKLLDDEATWRRIRMGSLPDAVAHGDIVFIAVQTPHGEEYEGITRVPEDTADFDYTMLQDAVEQVNLEACRQDKHITMVVISTVLPGTCEREILRLVSPEHVSFVYAPMFIAQSTVVEDTLNPEFVLLGVDKTDARGIEEVRMFFESMHPADRLELMGVADAESTKVAYNTFLGFKILAANTWMEICHKTGGNVDRVMNALKKATDRIVSGRYMNAGMGDGGGCHPRDVIALSHLAERLELSFDLGGTLATGRERQTQWLADLVIEETRDGKLPIVILGKAYKKGTNLCIGSPAVLLANMLKELPSLEVRQWDPYVDGTQGGFSLSAPFAYEATPDKVTPCPAVYVVATDHDEFFTMTFPKDSVVVDPWGRMSDIEGVKVVRVGRNS